jgi:hypothetical protein
VPQRFALCAFPSATNGEVRCEVFSWSSMMVGTTLTAWSKR